MSSLKNTLRNWVKIEEEINLLQKKLAKLKRKKMELTPDLINYMNKSNKEKIPVNSSYNIVVSSRTQYSSITKSHINNTLNNFLERKLAEEIIEKIYDSREKKIINNLEIKKK